MKVTIGGGGHTVHIEKPSNRGYSYDGYHLLRLWEKDIDPALVEKTLAGGKRICPTCIAAWRKDLGA